jgi:hypothetical protein
VDHVCKRIDEVPELVAGNEVKCECDAVTVTDESNLVRRFNVFYYESCLTLADEMQ